MQPPSVGATTICGLNLQLDNGGGNNHTCLSLDCPRRRQSDHTCHHPHRLSKLVTKCEKWNAKPRLSWVSVRNPPSETPVDVLHWTCRSQGKWQAKEPPRVAYVSEGMKPVEELDTLGGGGEAGREITLPIAWRRERRRKKHSTIFIGRTRKGHRQSDEHWNYSHTNARTYTRTHSPSPPPKRDTHARLMDNQISRNGCYCNIKFPSSQIQNRLTCDTIQNFQVVQQTGCPKKTRLMRMTKGIEIST